MKPEQWYIDTMSFNWKGHQGVYKILPSQKPWLVLIHGFPTSSFDWYKIWDKLSNHFSLIAPDLLGFGYSAKPKSFPYSIMHQADLVENLLAHLNIESFHLLAHDYGDTVAQELLARDSEKEISSIQTCCMLNGGLFPETHQPIPIQRLLMSPIGRILSLLLNKKKFVRSFSKVFGKDTKLQPEEYDDYWKMISRDNGHHIAYLLIRYMKERSTNRERWVGALQTFQKPLALIDGLEDPISGGHMVKRYREVVSDSNVFTLPGIGHYPQLEAPGELLTYYLEFRKDHN